MEEQLIEFAKELCKEHGISFRNNSDLNSFISDLLKHSEELKYQQTKEYFDARNKRLVDIIDG